MLDLTDVRAYRALPKRSLVIKGQLNMAQTKFGAGERVSILRSGAFSAPTGAYRIVRALPLESGPRQYQVRSETENFDRIMDESRLEAVRFE